MVMGGTFLEAGVQEIVSSHDAGPGLVTGG